LLALIALTAIAAAPASGRTVTEPVGAAVAAEPWTDPVAIWSRARLFLNRGSLAATNADGRRVLHAGFSGSTFDRINYGVRYARSTDSGAAWTVSRRLNGDRQAAINVHVGAAGSRVYLTWHGWRQGANGSRAIYFRANTDSGAPSAWKPTIRLTSPSERPSSPALAASGASVYVVYRDKRAKAIYLETSRDRGTTWDRQRLAHWQDAHGAKGPALAASGGTVAVTWKVADRVESRISVDGGRSFGPPAQVGRIGTEFDEATLAALGSQVAVGWTGGDLRHVVRLWSGGTWAPPVEIPTPLTDTGDHQQSPLVALGGTDQLGVLFLWDDAYHWRYTSNAGATWSPDELIPAGPRALVFHASGDVDVLGGVASDDGEPTVGSTHRVAVEETSAP
jgi:hypothetical protein